MNNRLKEFRTRYNLTQQGLAKKVDVTRQTILALEKQRYDPSLKLALKIARIFNCQVEDIFTLNDFDDPSLISKANCPKCNSIIEKDSKFCRNCGSITGS